MTRITTTTPLAVGADYHDALVTARRAKSLLFLLLMIGLIAQITIFFLARFEKGIRITRSGDATVQMPTEVKVTSTTAPSTERSTGEVSSTHIRAETKTVDAGGPVAWLVNAVVYLGTILSIVLAVVVLLITLVMLVGHLLGVSNVTSAFVWSVLLVVLLFPWQLFYGPDTASATSSMRDTASTPHSINIDDFRVPGVLYTWGELVQGVEDFPTDFNKVAMLRYARFVGFPLFALVVLFMVKAKSGRGVKLALGETEVHVDVSPGV